jgi:hypothetical protein
MLAVRDVGQVLAKLVRAYEAIVDLGVLPFPEGLRAAAHSTQRLATEMQAHVPPIRLEGGMRNQLN